MLIQFKFSNRFGKMSGHDENWRPKVLITRNDVPKEAFEIIGFK